MKKIKTIWRLVDGKAGHDKQSLALVENLKNQARCKIFNLNIQNLTNGPGKLTQAMQISISQYNADLTKKSAVFITEGIKPKKILRKSRVGITKGIDKLWNFSFNI